MHEKVPLICIRRELIACMSYKIGVTVVVIACDVSEYLLSTTCEVANLAFYRSVTDVSEKTGSSRILVKDAYFKR